MNQCSGKYLDGIQAKPRPATLFWSKGESSVLLVVDESAEEIVFDLADTHLEPPIGKNAPRLLHLSLAARFQTPDSAAIDQLAPLLVHQKMGPEAWASKIEQYKFAVLFSVLVIIAFVFAAYRFGIPIAADSLASKLPQDFLESIDENSMDYIETLFRMEPSELDSETADRLNQRFEYMISELGSEGIQYKLRFYSFFPNALALPGGTIVFSDELAELLDEEGVAAVLAHEIAHVEMRHGVRQLLRTAGVSLLISFLTSDIGVSVGAFAGLPEILASTGFSRAFETEADMFAAQYMCEVSGTPEAMAIALKALADKYQMSEDEPYEFISTHPAIYKRIDAINSYSCAE